MRTRPLTLVVGVTVPNGGYVLGNPEPYKHLVEFYDSDSILAKKVAQFLADGWRNGEALIMAGTLAHRQTVLAELDEMGIDARDPNRARFLDADEMLERILIDGWPDWARFDQHLGATLRELQMGYGSVRAFGELVGVLWSRGSVANALRIEEFWCRALAGGNCSLFCAYAIDLLAREFDERGVHSILQAHTHLLPFDADQCLAGALRRSMDEVLGKGAERLRRLVREYFRPAKAAVPDAEAMVLWVRANLPQHSGLILERARQYYQAELAGAAELQ
jgi:MEDS: MEthanogen/methylotroph, DcmR Sensory domain